MCLPPAIKKNNFRIGYKLLHSKDELKSKVLL